MGEDFLEILEGIRLALSYLGTGRPPGRESRGALELVAGSISGESGSLAEEMSHIAGPLGSIAHNFDDENLIRRVTLSATENFRYSTRLARSAGLVLDESYADETVREFVEDWLVITRDETHRVPRRHVNDLYTSWCEYNRISPEDRVTTSVLRQSLNLLGVELLSGQPDEDGTRTHVFVGVLVRDGAAI